MGGLDYLIADLFRSEIEEDLGKRTTKKIEKRLFEKYGITLTQSMNDFAKFDDTLREFFGKGARGMIRSTLRRLCSLDRSKGKKDASVTVHDPNLTETILEMLGDRDYRRILDMLICKTMTSQEILKNLDIPQASAYRKIDALVDAGLLVEDGKIVPESGRPTILLTTVYRGLDMRIEKNQVIVQVMLNKRMLAKSTILSTVYSL